MKEERLKDLLFWSYMIIALVLAMIYFSVPERAVFLSSVMDWWTGIF